jgi:hypothetical protein
MPKPVFSLSKRRDEWSTHQEKMTFTNQVVYPIFVSSTNADVFKSGEALGVLTAVKKADELGFRHIHVCCGATIPTE